MHLYKQPFPTNQSVPKHGRGSNICRWIDRGSLSTSYILHEEFLQRKSSITDLFPNFSLRLWLALETYFFSHCLSSSLCPSRMVSAWSDPKAPFISSHSPLHTITRQVLFFSRPWLG